MTSKRRDWALTGAEWFLRIALAAAYLSAVADRFGFWGPPGTPGVAWGAWQPFLEYASLLNGYAPASVQPALAWTATIAEGILAVGLLVGWRLGWFAAASGVLLSIFGVTMIAALGVKPPLDYSVFTGAAASFLLATHRRSECGDDRPPESGS